MKVRQLIEKLQTQDPDMDVAVAIDHEGNTRTPYRVYPCHQGESGISNEVDWAEDYPGDNCVLIDI